MILRVINEICKQYIYIYIIWNWLKNNLKINFTKKNLNKFLSVWEDYIILFQCNSLKIKMG